MKKEIPDHWFSSAYVLRKELYQTYKRKKPRLTYCERGFISYNDDEILSEACSKDQ